MGLKLNNPEIESRVLHRQSEPGAPDLRLLRVPPSNVSSAQAEDPEGRASCDGNTKLSPQAISTSVRKPPRD